MDCRSENRILRAWNFPIRIIGVCPPPSPPPIVQGVAGLTGDLVRGSTGVASTCTLALKYSVPDWSAGPDLDLDQDLEARRNQLIQCWVSGVYRQVGVILALHEQSSISLSLPPSVSILPFQTQYTCLPIDSLLFRTYLLATLPNIG